jgi:hypothetical protein
MARIEHNEIALTDERSTIVTKITSIFDWISEAAVTFVTLGAALFILAAMTVASWKILVS